MRKARQRKVIRRNREHGEDISLLDMYPFLIVCTAKIRSR